VSNNERGYLEDLSVGGRILKRIFNQQDGYAWRGFMLHRKGKVAGYCKKDNEPSGSTKCGKLHDYLRNY
jgi:hypothetical protein